MLSTTLATALSMPRFTSRGFAPEATFFMPSVRMACASTVAVVVPSPASSPVLLATLLTSCAPELRKGSSSSISFATLTPSLVMRGAPNFLSITTLRPFGPRVTFTAFASASAPSRRSSRASTSYLISFAMIVSLIFLIFCSKQVTSKRVYETEMSCKLYFSMSSLSCLLVNSFTRQLYII